MTTRPPPVSGFVQDGPRITIDNPCRDQTAAPPYTPEIGAVLFDGSDVVAGLEPVTTIETGTPTVTFRVPDTVTPGTYRLEVQCIAHRVSTPLAIFASMVDIVAAGPGTSPTTTAPPGQVPTPPAAAPVPGAPSFTG